MFTLGRLVCFSTLVTLVFGQGCSNNFNATGYQNPQSSVEESLSVLQGVLFIVCFGIFGVFVSSMYRLIRAYVFYDNHLLDTYFDAGGEVNFAMVACSVVAKRLWVASYSFSTDDVYKFGLVGHFWYSAAGVIHLLLFAIVASEIRVKAPGARTFLQVIRSRFGPVPHIIVMIFAFVTNIIIAGLIMAEGTRILTWLCKDIDHYTICVILTAAVGLYTVVGGVGGTMYMAYFCVACVVALYLVYFSDAAFNSLHRPDYPFNSFFVEVDTAVRCSKSDFQSNTAIFGSLLTFQSRSGMLQGIVFALAGFSSVFVNQGFWLTAISAKPTHSVWGYLMGSFVWFAIPFILSFVFGMSYWKFAYDQGTHLVSSTTAASGILPVLVSQQLLGRFGDFMMYALTLAVVLTSVSSEILSMSSIIVYDIFQTYLYPFDISVSKIDSSYGSALETKKAMGNSFLRYNRKCIIFQWITVIAVSILVYPITLIILAIGMELQWLFNFLGVLVGSAILPICLAIIWHRTTCAGITFGVLVGFVCGVCSWLIYASRWDGGLQLFQFNTGRQEVFIVGLAVSMGVGGLICIFVSLTCGGCDPHRNEEEEWEKCRSVDNPVMRWTTHYSSAFNSVNPHTGLPHFYALRRAFKCAEVSAYVIGVLLSVGAVLVWPAIMLAVKVFTPGDLYRWAIMVFVWAIIAGAFICIVPLLYEIIESCCVSYSIRVWKHQMFAANAQSSRSKATYLRSTGTCKKPAILARQTIHLADVPTRIVDVRPSGYITEVTEFSNYAPVGCVGTYRTGVKGVQTFVEVD